VRCAQPPRHGRTFRLRAAAGARSGHRAGADAAGRRPARPGRAPRRLRRALPARTLGRPASARLHRSGAGLRARRPHPRRVDGVAGRLDPGPGRRPAAAAAGGAGADLRLHRPRPRRRGADQPRGAGDAPRGDGRAGTRAGRAVGPQPPLHARAARGNPARRAAGAQLRALSPQGFVRAPAPTYADAVTATVNSRLPGELADATSSDASLRRFLHGLPGVDQVGAEARAARLGTRSIKTTAKAYAIDLAIRMVDLTTLEGQDTPGKVRSLASKAMRPDPTDPDCPATAAVCVYPDLVGVAKETLGDSGVQIAAVATAFPSGRAALDIKLADTADAVEAGADEIDMVIDRGAFLEGRYLDVFDEIVAVREACRRPDGSEAHLKVIFETGELQTYDNVRRASWLAMLAGGHFIKTSAGKVSPAATLPVTLVMLEAVRDFREATGQMVGVKPAGGIRTTKDAIKYLVMVNETCGPDWLDP